MIGKPRAIRDELIVLGRDSNGEGKKYILDAISGDVLAIEEARLPEPRRDDLGTLPPPVHAPSLATVESKARPWALRRIAAGCVSAGACRCAARAGPVRYGA